MQLFLVAVLPLTVLLLAVTFGSLSLHHRAMRSLVGDRNLRAVQAAAGSLNQEVTHLGEILEILSFQASEPGDLNRLLSEQSKQLARFTGGVAILGPERQILASNNDPLFDRLWDEEGWKKVSLELTQIEAGQAIYSQTFDSGDQIFAYAAVRNERGNSLVGVFSPAVLIRDGLKSIAEIEPLTAVVVDQDYTVLYRKGSLGAEESIVGHPGIADGLSGESGITYLPTRAGEHVVTYSPVPPLGWALMIEESWEDVASPLLRLTQFAPLVLIPTLVLSLVALWFALRQIVQPLQALQAKTEDLAQGNFNSIRQPVGGVPEIRLLQSALEHMAKELKAAQESLHTYIGALTAGVENERRNLARELHDDTLQAIIGLNQQSQIARMRNQNPEVEKTLDQMIKLGRQTIVNLRRMVRGLRPIYLEDLGLVTAIEMLATEAERPSNLDVHFKLNGLERRLKPDVEMALYRISQEAVSNVARHAGAANAWIELTFHPDHVTLVIRDDGKGFHVPTDSANFARQGHYGLLGLYERAELIGAQISISSNPGEGTTITTHLQDR